MPPLHQLFLILLIFLNPLSFVRRFSMKSTLLLSTNRKLVLFYIRPSKVFSTFDMASEGKSVNFAGRAPID